MGKPDKFDKAVSDLSARATRLSAALAAQGTASHESAAAGAVAYRQRFRFSLAIGHGAGLVYVGAMITSNSPIIEWWHILPSAWCFVLGVMASGALLIIASIEKSLVSDRWRLTVLLPQRAQIDDLANELDELKGTKRTPKSPLPPDDDLIASIALTERRLVLTSRVLEVSSAALFVAAVLYPLIVLSSRTSLVLWAV